MEQNVERDTGEGSLPEVDETLGQQLLTSLWPDWREELKECEEMDERRDS